MLQNLLEQKTMSSMNIEKENQQLRKIQEDQEQQLIRNNQVDQEKLKQQKKKLKEQHRELKAEKAKLKVCLHVIILCPTYKLYLFTFLPFPYIA